MSGNRSSQNRPNRGNGEVDSSLIKEFIQLQKEQISVDKGEQALKKDHLKNQFEIAQQSLRIQDKLLEKAPTERRKDRFQIFFFVGFLFLVVIGLSIYCLHFDHTEFLKYFIGALTHLGAIWLGYYFGRKKDQNKSPEENDIQDAEIID